MEQRTWKRDSIALNMEIRMWRPEGEQVVNCKTLDVSLGGAELLCYGTSFPRHRVLEIRFSHMCNKRIKQPRILAKFIRKTQHGIAIQFLKANNETLRSLQSLILKDKIMQNKIMQNKISQMKYGHG
jgi:hypothetical protein